MRSLTLGAAAFAGLILIGCNGGGNAAGSNTPQGASQVAEAATKGVYDDDLNAVRLSFDDDLRKGVTIDQVGTISGRLKALGAYKGLSAVSADQAKGRYDFTAQFDQTTVPLHVRVDADGRLAAYRLDLSEPVASR